MFLQKHCGLWVLNFSRYTEDADPAHPPLKFRADYKPDKQTRPYRWRTFYEEDHIPEHLFVFVGDLQGVVDTEKAEFRVSVQYEQSE